MTEDGPDENELAVEQLVELYTRQNALRKEFTDAQLAALDALWRAERAGQVSGEAVREIEELIRAGHVHRARRRLSQLRCDDSRDSS
ncbi:MAG: hypothetical protein J2P24_02525 [Streptosporangiales bacterium]|nr:hypothetical protein [Streptosporangiales bacterium]MBO0890586.1 hypothetical protein [Acidothermales bacterium]